MLSCHIGRYLPHGTKELTTPPHLLLCNPVSYSLIEGGCPSCRAGISELSWDLVAKHLGRGKRSVQRKYDNLRTGMVASGEQ